MAQMRIKLAAKEHPPFDAARRDRLLDVMSRGVAVWNRWLQDNPDAYIDLRDADLFSRFGERTTTGEKFPLPNLDLHDANLSGASLAKLDLTGANLSAVYAVRANFQAAKLNDANLAGAYMTESDFILARINRADMRIACLSHSNLFMAEINNSNMRRAGLASSQISQCEFVDAILAQVDFEDASLRNSDLTRANLTGADLNNCRVFGTSVWKTSLDNTRQTNLIITPAGEPELTTDNLKVAQFIYLILNNQEVREIIDSITSKVVLVLGRFTEERKPVLDAIRQKLGELNYIPVMFDFTRPSSKTFIGTIKTLASMTRFVIADLTDARVVIQEIDVILREYPGVPVQPVLLAGQRPPDVILDYTDFDTFLDIYLYRDREMLLANLVEHLIAPAEDKIADILSRRSRLMNKLFGNSVANPGCVHGLAAPTGESPHHHA